MEIFKKVQNIEDNYMCSYHAAISFWNKMKCLHKLQGV